MNNCRKMIQQLEPNKALSFVVIYEENSQFSLFDKDLIVYNTVMNTHFSGPQLTLDKNRMSVFINHLENKHINYLYLVAYHKRVMKKKAKQYENNQYFAYCKNYNTPNKQYTSINRRTKKKRNKKNKNDEITITELPFDLHYLQKKAQQAKIKEHKDLSIIQEKDKSFVDKEVQKKKELKEAHRRNINDY